MQPKRHFEVLDGLRGVAALGVVLFHFMEWIFPDFSKNFIGHGYLAVDFFFCLSGFVIAYAYDNRLETMGVKAFFKARLIRLHPLVVLGSLLGLLCFLFDPFAAPPAAYNAGRVALLFAASVLLIPLPIMEDRSFNLFGLNAPSWSLFWEYVANITYALFLHRAGRRVLLPLAVVSAGVLCWVSYRTGNLVGGWAGSNFWDGGARVAYSFLAGLLLFRFRWIIPNRLGFLPLAGLLAGAFLLPFYPWNWLTDALVVLFYFPLIVSLGAGSVLSPRMTGICTFSGNISYPLYMTHYGAIWIFGHYFTAQPPDTGTLVLIVAGGTLFLLGFASLVLIFFDAPVRRYLQERWRGRR
ncbi:MAG TPA: acyltransferase [Chitinophagaceae bacterium]|nr:acyltransferase [Chitinophagaceae bacterium]